MAEKRLKRAETIMANKDKKKLEAKNKDMFDLVEPGDEEQD
jgi:hypothetical protein